MNTALGGLLHGRGALTFGLLIGHDRVDAVQLGPCVDGAVLGMPTVLASARVHSVVVGSASVHAAFSGAAFGFTTFAGIAALPTLTGAVEKAEPVEQALMAHATAQGAARAQPTLTGTITGPVVVGLAEAPRIIGTTSQSASLTGAIQGRCPKV